MKIAVVYNRESRNVINLFGSPNQEKIGLKTVQRIADALRSRGHQVTAFEGDKDLVDRLEDFMPRVLKGERPGMVFNLSYGIQGQARYTHVPSILEMVGIPYVASGPLAHSLALDKVVTKMILRQNGLPTPDFVVLESPDMPVPDLTYPAIVKPKNEAVSFGLKVVNDADELREAAGVIFETYGQAVLAEQYIEGREVNVGLLGNGPPEPFAPVELSFGSEGPTIYTYEDKTGKSGRTIEPICPAPIGERLTRRAQEIAVKAFEALGIADCARVDMRIDKDDNLYILEINSLPSLGEHGSYLVGAAHAGLDFSGFVNRLVEVASARYFGTPHPPRIDRKTGDASELVFSYLTERRDRIERRLKEWTNSASRTSDPVGLRETVKRLHRLFEDVGMKKVDACSDDRSVHVWQTSKGFEGGTLCIGHIDVPVGLSEHRQPFRRDPEWVYGEGIASAKAPLVTLEFALRALRSLRRLRQLPIGVLYYMDEGADCRYSGEFIRDAATKAARVLVLRSGIERDSIVIQRRGRRKYRLIVQDSPRRPGLIRRRLELPHWMAVKIDELARLSSKEKSLSVSTADLQTQAYSLLIPHHISTTLLVTYLDQQSADELESSMPQPSA